MQQRKINSTQSVIENDRISIIQKKDKRKDELNVLQGHRIHTPSLFCSVTHHNLSVLSESRILYLLACSEHFCTCCECAQTPQIKHACGARITVRVQALPVLDKNKAQICCSERTSGNGILLDRPLPFKLHQSYRPLPRCIR